MVHEKELKNYKLEELIDIPLFQIFLDRLNEVMSYPSAIIDNESNILTATNWQDICTKFYRANPESEKECKMSDQYILSHITDGNSTVTYRCPHGLVDNATPIIIEGKHLGNFFIGQLFLEKPDMEFFKQQAKKYGFDEKTFLDAVSRVPILTKDQLDKNLRLVKMFTEILASIGLKNFKERQASQIIYEKEERLRFALNAANQGMWDMDVRTGKFVFSPEFSLMLGFDPSEYLMDLDTFSALLHPDDKKMTLDTLDRYLHGEIPKYSTEFRIKTGSGAWKWILSQGKIVDYDIDNTPIRIVGTLTDINERKRAEEELQIALIKYKTLFSAFPLGITVAEKSGKILESNRMAERLLGLSLEEHQRRKIDGKEWTIVKPDGTPLPAQDYASVRALRENRLVENMEMGIVKAQGDITWINVTAAPLPLEGHSVVIIYNDITQRKRAEAELHLLNQTLKAAQSMAKVGYWSYDIKTDIPTWSEQMFVVFGVKTGKVPPYDEHRKIWYPDDWDLFNTSFQDCKKGKPYNIVVRIIFPDKSIHYINTQGFPRYNEKGEISELFGTSQDITEHKRTEEELRKHREHLEELVKERTSQLNQKNEELEQFNRVFVGRELRMIQLKEQIAALEKKVAQLEKKNEGIKEPHLNSKGEDSI